MPHGVYAHFVPSTIPYNLVKNLGGLNCSNVFLAVNAFSTRHKLQTGGGVAFATNFVFQVPWTKGSATPFRVSGWPSRAQRTRPFTLMQPQGPTRGCRSWGDTGGNVARGEKVCIFGGWAVPWEDHGGWTLDVGRWCLGTQLTTYWWYAVPVGLTMYRSHLRTIA